MVDGLLSGTFTHCSADDEFLAGEYEERHPEGWESIEECWELLRFVLKASLPNSRVSSFSGTGEPRSLVATIYP